MPQTQIGNYNPIFKWCNNLTHRLNLLQDIMLPMPSLSARRWARKACLGQCHQGWAEILLVGVVKIWNQPGFSGEMEGKVGKGAFAPWKNASPLPFLEMSENIYCIPFNSRAALQEFGHRLVIMEAS